MHRTPLPKLALKKEEEKNNNNLKTLSLTCYDILVKVNSTHFSGIFAIPVRIFKFNLARLSAVKAPRFPWKNKNPNLKGGKVLRVYRSCYV
jgi:hypothetical protein